MYSRIIQEPAHLEMLKVFLQENKLPFQDVTLNGSYYFTYQSDEDTLVASGGLELYGDYALLRSIAVDENFRGRQLGKQIVNDLLITARKQGIKELYLLTETASAFFEQRGFVVTKRSLAPKALLQSTEFTSTCPASATCMMLSL